MPNKTTIITKLYDTQCRKVETVASGEDPGEGGLQGEVRREVQAGTRQGEILQSSNLIRY